MLLENLKTFSKIEKIGKQLTMQVSRKCHIGRFSYSIQLYFFEKLETLHIKDSPQVIYKVSLLIRFVIEAFRREKKFKKLWRNYTSKIYISGATIKQMKINKKNTIQFL